MRAVFYCLIQIMDIPGSASLVLFDGVCNLCDSWVQRIIRNDPHKNFYFASLQSEMGQKIYKEYGIVDNETILLIQNKMVYQKSQAAFRILKELNSPFRLLALFRVFPSFLTDFGYDLIARYRYRIFGKKDECIVSKENVRDRFVD